LTKCAILCNICINKRRGDLPVSQDGEGGNFGAVDTAGFSSSNQGGELKTKRQAKAIAIHISNAFIKKGG